ncbi:cold shock and DUF1294 domain-containing protein [Roseateles sp.]|uniref:cold shock and DUF1294 domain-containing protein n=1 Tax=Roseateles sp. TaxID=1971397 RepID=UPI00286ADA3A|nr:cold shock and DUF1294 domain-containing protein [Roseateles sp.]
MRQQGLLSQWDDAKGYGFITPANGEPKLFVHIKAFDLRAERPRLGETLSFEIGHDGQGKRRALNVRGQQQLPAANPSVKVFSRLWLIPAFAALYLLCHLLWPLPPAVWGTYMAMSMASFIVYAGDKRAAAKGHARVPERTLHGLALACGWPGALLAQHLLRHKSSKPAFVRVFWFTVGGNVLLFVLLATPLLKQLLRLVQG